MVIFMDLFLSIAVLFCIGSLGGWILELLFRRFFSSHKWINPGFLVGPYLPLYGFGVMFLFLISYYIDFSKWFGLSYWLNAILVIIIMGIVMTVIEYIAGIIFIKGMKIKLWDYSDRWGNIQGIICPLFSFFWLIICAAFYFLMKTPCEHLVAWFATRSLSNAWLPFSLGVFYGVICVDFAYSIKITTKIKSYAKEHNIVVRYERFKEHIRDFQEKQKEKINYILPFKTEDFKKRLEEYVEKTKQEAIIKKEHIKEKLTKK